MSQNIRYQALGPLLSGEGSRAFLGLATADGAPARPVVMIWLPPEVAQDGEQVLQIHKETLRAVTLEHPNIIRVHGLASMDEGVARVVEFADGEPLRRVLEVCHKLPLPFAALVVADLAMGLHYAHLAGNDDGTPLVHGDIRPETVMVCFSGTTKVSGYGALSVAPREAGGKRVVHRRHYAAPEQIIGGRNAISVPTDVYLLGLILFEALTGMMPFQGEANFDQAVVNKPLTLTGYEEIPAALVPVLQRATAKRAQDRYPSALAFREALEAAVGPFPSHKALAEYLEQNLPEGDPARAARRRVLDAGLADYARKMWDPKAQASGMRPMLAPEVVAVTPAPTAQAPAAPAPAPVPQAKAPAGPPRAAEPKPRPSPVTAVTRPSGEVSSLPPPPQRNVLPVVLVSALGAAALTLAVVSHFNRSAVPPSAPVALAPAPPPPAPPASTAPAPVPTAPVDAPAEPETKAAVKPAAFKAPEPPAVLELAVTPPVEVLIDHKPVGRSPLNLPLPAGRHVLQLRDKAQGINLSRTVNMPHHGREVTRIAVEKGFLTVNIPAGAVMSLDGKALGRASVTDVPIWEGSHHLVVMLGTAKWQQAFDVGPGEHMKYDVEAQPN